MTHPYLVGTASPKVLAHRGLVTARLAEAGIAENSRAAVAAAVAEGSDYVESDCHLTRDGEVVLFHDADLSRVTGDPRPLVEVGLGELASIMEPLGGLLTLEQALDEFPRTRFNIDVKASGAAEPAGRLIAPHAQRVLLTSFSDERRRRALAAATTGGRESSRPATSPGRSGIIGMLLAVASRSRRLEVASFSGLDAIQIPERSSGVRVLSPRVIDAAHRNGVEVHVWTVNEPTRMRELVDLGVDGIVTDRADAALRLLR